MISNWLINFLGTIGTAALLLVVGVSYLIWQFNPAFKIPHRKSVPDRYTETGMVDISNGTDTIDKKGDVSKSDMGTMDLNLINHLYPQNFPHDKIIIHQFFSTGD